MVNTKVSELSIQKRAIKFCEDHNCEDCIVFKKDLDYRTKEEKELEHMPCVENLIRYYKENN